MNILLSAENWKGKLGLLKNSIKKTKKNSKRSFDKVFNNGGKEEPAKIKTERSWITDESGLFYNKKCNFIKFYNIGKYMNGSLGSRYNNHLAQSK